MEKKQLLITIFGLFVGIAFLVFVVMTIISFFNKPQQPTGAIPTPTKPSSDSSGNNTRPTGSPLNSMLIPTATTEGRVDENALSVKGSTEELAKIEPFLNYQQELTLSNGTLVDIVISKRGLQETPWILPVSIGGIKFQLPENDPKYNAGKQSFKEASQAVFDWLTAHNVNVKKIYIRWGDKAFIQERAEKWLSE